MHAAPRCFGLSILTSRLGRLAVRGWECGAAIVGLSFGSGIERPVVAGSGSIRAAAAIGSSTGAIGSATVERETKGTTGAAKAGSSGWRCAHGGSKAHREDAQS